jgi:hypothetical protein
MTRKLVLLLILLLGAYPSVSSAVESCSRNGCLGPGYIFVPDPIGLKSFILGGHLVCADPEDMQTFPKPGLPLVNEVVTLKASARRFFDESDIEANIEAFQPPHVVDPGVKPGEDCHAVWHEPDAQEQLEAGMKVRILGYRTFVSHLTRVWGPSSYIPRPYTKALPQQLMFALVEVVRDDE